MPDDLPPDDAEDEDKLARLLEKRAELDRNIQSLAKEMAVLFTDIKGSTKYFEERGDLEGMALLKRHNGLLFPLVEKNRGRIVKTIGDAIMAVFESAEDAARCGSQMQQALWEERRRNPQEPIHIRVGSHWGKVMVQGQDVFGDTVNTTSRIEHNAQPDEVLVSRALANALPPGSFELISRGTVAAKGKADPQEVVAIRWGQGAPPPPPPKASSSAGPVPAEPAGAAAEITPMSREYEVFVLELQVSPGGLKVSAVEGLSDKGTVKAYEEVPVDRAALEKLSSPFATFLQSGGASGSYRERVREAGLALYGAALSERVQSRLRGTGIQFLRMHLDDELVFVPWELAHDGTDYLAVRFAVGRMVTARAKNAPVVAPLSDESHAIAVVVSNPSGDLPAAREEGKAVAGLLRDGFRGTVTHLEGPVTKAAFLSALRDARLLHFAGHAQRGGGSVRGGFRLADGVATPEEIAAAVGNRAPALVFANGCHASGGGWVDDASRRRARSENEGGGTPTERFDTVQGTFTLASSLLMRGAQHFIGPTWEIPDADALAFALRFYENALARIPFGESVRLARSSLVAGSASPLSFAGYVLYGEPRQKFPAHLVSLERQSKRGAAMAAVKVASAVASAAAPALARKKPFLKTKAGRGVVAGAAVLASAAAAGELLVSVKTLVDAPPAAVSGTAADGGTAPAPGATQLALAPVETSPAIRHEGPVRVSFLPLKNLSQSELPGLESVLQESGIAGLADAGIAVVERGQLDDRNRDTFDTIFDELVISNSSGFWDKEKRAALGLQQGAEVAVLGAFQKSGKVIRLNARFVDVETGEVLHSLKLDRTLEKDEQIFDLQDAFEAEVAKAVPIVKKKLRPEDAR